jgi:hypothetical protein
MSWLLERGLPSSEIPFAARTARTRPQDDHNRNTAEGLGQHLQASASEKGEDNANGSITGNGRVAAMSNETVTSESTSEPIKVDLDWRAVLARVNRALEKDHKQLRKCRAKSAAFRKLGEYYLVVLEPAAQIVDTRVDLTKLATELGVLEAYEQIGAVSGTNA